MDRELLIFYKKHGIPLDDGYRLAGTQAMPPSNVHRSQPVSSCVQLIARYRHVAHSESRRAEAIRAREEQREAQLEAAQQAAGRLKAECEALRRECLAAAETQQR